MTVFKYSTSSSPSHSILKGDNRTLIEIFDPLFLDDTHNTQISPFKLIYTQINRPEFQFSTVH